MFERTDAKPVLTGVIYDREVFAGSKSAGTIGLGRYQRAEEMYQMADSKPMGQTYYEEVEALKTKGVSNADAVRQVAEKYGKNENAVRGGIHQYRSRHVGGSSGPTATARRGRSKAASVDDLVANAREALEAALQLVDKEVEEAKAALDAAQKHYHNVSASVKDRKADIQKKLRALA
jgi:predicted NBD/HSP70 family sugar kinase